MKTDFSKYVDIPYKHRGRDFDGCDCLGLVVLMYKEERGIILPDYLDIEYNCDLNENDDTYLEEGWSEQMKKAWRPVKPPLQKWDGLLFYANSRRVVADHMGICIGDDKFLHTSAHYKMSMVSKLDKFWLSKLYAGARYIGAS